MTTPTRATAPTASTPPASPTPDPGGPVEVRHDHGRERVVSGDITTRHPHLTP